MTPSHEALPATPHELFERLVQLLLRRYREGSPSNTHVVVVLGAASSLWSGLPLWDAGFKDQLVTLATAAFPDFVKECWRKLSPTIGLPPRAPRWHRGELVKRASIEDLASVALEYA